MDFINKLIKKGIFGLALCFSFLALFAGEKVSAASECKIEVLNDGEYLVLNEGVGWSDSGAQVICGDPGAGEEVIHSNVAVSVNGATPVTNSAFGQYVSDSYTANAGFYAIKYSWVADETVTITRYVRVLPSNLNDVKNIWVGDFKDNTAEDDSFVKVIDHKNNYIAIGNFGTNSYVAYFASTGKYLWHVNFEGFELKEIAKSEDANGNIYYIAGKNNNGKGFVKAIQLNEDEGINDAYVVESELANVSVVNKLVVSSSNVYAVGYKTNNNGTKTGKIVRLTHNVTTFDNIVYSTDYSTTLSYEYNSVILSRSLNNGNYNIISIGNTAVSGASGATGGLVTTCSVDLSTCTSKSPYLWKNNNSNTTTIFNDIVEVGNTNYYVVVGNSRIDSLYASSNTKGGGEAALVVLLDGNLEIINGGLKGSFGFDSLYSIKSLSTYQFITVGEQSGNGLYLTLKVDIVDDKSTLTVTEDGIDGLNGNVKIKDVYVKSNSGQLSYVFVGSATTSTIEDISIGSKGNGDAFVAVVDETKFSNYDNKNVLQGSAICSGGLTTCKASELNEEYQLGYGSSKIQVSAYDQYGNEMNISSENVGSYAVFHEFSNGNGVNFVIGKLIVITATPVAPNISVENQGIDKWYLYSRYEQVSANVGGHERKALWSERYMPIDNNLDKKAGVTYYVFQHNASNLKWEFAEDESERTYTYNNYVKLEDEPLQSNVAFQSEEKLEEYALLQEFARVAFVNERYDFRVNNISAYQNEDSNLSRQNYYFVYYIDLEFSNDLNCGTQYGELIGKCNQYTGYAFSSLKKIKEVATLITEKYDSFKNEKLDTYVAKDNINLPSTTYFQEELTTMRYMQNAEVNLTENLYLEVAYYAIDPSNAKEFVSVPVVTSKTAQNKVSFASAKENGDYTEEGKYVVRYCYNYVDGGENVDNCGSSATFVIDRTRPVINYKMLNDTYGYIETSWSADRPYPIGYSMTIQNMTDIDPYAYTVVNNQKYYLQCNVAIGSQQCLDDLERYVLASYAYDKTNPDKLFNIKVYDRAGNFVDAYFKIGTDKPGMSITPSANSDSFSLTIDFFDKNAIRSFGFYFTSNEVCDADTPCTDATAVESAIIDYINALIHNNTVLIESAKTNPAINLEAQLVKSIVLHFNSSKTPNGGVSIPKATLSEIDGMIMYTFTDPETPFLVSDGLYEFTLYDEFNNVVNGYAGIGLDRAELDININADYNAEEVVWNDSLGEYEYKYEKRIPLTKDERGDNPNDELTFLVSELSKYNFAVPNGLKNDFDSNMYFTNRFVYMRFKVEEYSIVRISKANSLLSLGSYGESDEVNPRLDCLFKIYGSQAASKVGECTGGTIIPLEGLIDPSQLGTYEAALNAKGIYIIGVFNDYYHIVFTEEGVYDVWNEMKVTVETGGGIETVKTTPANYSFTIDRKSPEINLGVYCDGSDCKGEKTEADFSKNDFVYVDESMHKYNIGNFDMKVDINLDKLIGGESNQLIAIKIDGPGEIEKEIEGLVSAGVMACNPYKNPCNAYEFAEFKTYILFNKSGTYKITLYDGVYQEVYAKDPITQEPVLVHTYENSVSYTFVIDKEAPEIVEIVDANGKNFSLYQQYVDVKLNVSESTFLSDKEDATMLTLTYHIEGLPQETITVANRGGNCVLSTGSFDSEKSECSIDVSNGNLVLEVYFPINEDDKQSGMKNLILKAADYFGNEMSQSQTFYFDNNNPYIYFSSEYTPILNFGSDATTDELNQMLSRDADASLGTFTCGGADGIKFTVGIEEVEKVIMYCEDTPQITGVENDVKVESYEAQRVSFNNYIKGVNDYTLLENGTALKVTDVVYKKPYVTFSSQLDLEAHISQSLPVYIPVNTAVSSLDKVNPNEKYYLTESGTSYITINDLYTDSGKYASCDTSTSSECVLYNMYMNEGNFSKVTDSTVNPEGHTFYVRDENNMSYKTVGAVLLENWAHYYKESDMAYIQDEGKYLPALTLANSCVKISGGNCTPIASGRIKVVHNDVEYRNILSEKMTHDVNSNYPDTEGIIVSTTMSTGGVKYTVLDNRIWQIAYDNGAPVKFGFGLASNLGRPIIFVAIDGAGNISSNYLETVIAIKDNINPEISSVYKFYELDNSAAATENNYIKETKYYRLVSIPTVEACATSKSTYFKNESGTYTEVACDALEEGKQYYVSSVVYTPVADGMSKQEGVDYYKRKANDDLGTNYLTSENMVVEFSEPIYRIKCSYYLYDNSGSVAAEYNYNCGFDNTEFDYGDDKRSFYLEFNYDLGALTPNYFVQYTITVWDFSNNTETFSALYIDREKPTIAFNSNVSNKDSIEAVYTSGSTDESKYNNVYMATEFLQETLSKDSINNVISGDPSEINKFTYDVKYYEFNYDITYKNYVYNTQSKVYETVPDGKSKSTDYFGKTMYVLIKNPADYVLKGKRDSKDCVSLADGEYCYVQDDYNYYPSLLNDELYWKQLATGEYIKNNIVKVYKIEYKVTDYSGNVSDTLIKTVYCVDRIIPTLVVNGKETTNKYGYHTEVKLEFDNEKEAYVYVYQCKDTATNCELPSEIFASADASVRLTFKEVISYQEFLYNAQSIYKIYFHDRGNYVTSVNGDGIQVETLRYNFIEYTFLIDTTKPELYLEANKDANGNLFYSASLGQEEYLYCVSGDRFAEGLSFADEIECKNNPVFAGEWKNDSDYVNMSIVYEYFDGTYTYRVMNANGAYIIYKNATPYLLEYVDEFTYEYKGTDSYVLTVNGENYKLNINDAGDVDLLLTYSYKDNVNNNDYKFVTDGTNYKLFINGVENELVANNGVYEYKDTVNYISYSVRLRNGTYQIKVTNEKTITRQLYNSKGLLIYEEKYVKQSPYSQKYFYNTYYKYVNGEFETYALGAAYDENNVYMIEAINVYFREDGKYLLMAKDKSGNAAGRRLSNLGDYDSEYSGFTVDNSAPNYNKSQNAPTGINYWYSVPNVIIDTEEEVNTILSLTKDPSSNSYNIDGSGLNNGYFYAFATKREAEAYLNALYSAHINSLEDNTCTKNGKKGFAYTYYNPLTGEIVSSSEADGCFVGTGGKANKTTASDRMKVLAKQLVFATFAQNKMFSDPSINQKVCTSIECTGETNMYKTIYLQIDNTNNTRSVVETCNAVEGLIECIKVNAKMVKYDNQNGNSVPFEINGENAKDTSKIVVYSRSTKNNSSTSKSEYTASATIALNNDTYYIFEEFDTTISYINYPKGESAYTVTHTNVSYYAVYIDNTDYIDVYYKTGVETGSGSGGNLTSTGEGTVRTNEYNYSLIIKNNGDSNFENNYEIFALRDTNGDILEVYSYLIVEINDRYYYNLNDYIVRNGNDYYFEIPMPVEQLTKVVFIDRTGTRTRVNVSISKVAPYLEVVYNGEGGSQTVNLSIVDSILTKTATESVEILFSTNGQNYTSDKTQDILKALLCKSGTSGLVYDCINTGPANGMNSYRVIIQNLQDLYGFFKVNLTDNHGNTNTIEFMYNPADMSADYPNVNKFISNDEVARFEGQEIRMITNEQVELEFNNEVNYVILYKIVEGNLVEVCNTKNISDGTCVENGNTLNKVSRITDEEGNYLNSMLYYADEGVYTAQIINRASEVIYAACFTIDGNGEFVVKEDCKVIKTYRGVCSWDINSDFCDDPMEVIIKDVSKASGQTSYTKIEVDKTLPTVDVNKFTITSPTGEAKFVNNAIYKNAEVIIKWEEELVQLKYTCEYTDSALPCNGNSTGFYVNEFAFVAKTGNAGNNTKYTFWFEDFAGNSTINDQYTFTIEVVPPTIEIYEVDENGAIMQDSQVERNSTITNNAKLLCRLNGEVSNCNVYKIKLYSKDKTASSWSLVGEDAGILSTDLKYGDDITFRYVAYVKNVVTNVIYENIWTEFIFTIDKKAPAINLSSSPDELTGLYKGSVKVSLADTGLGIIYAGCVDTGTINEELGDRIYDCTNAVEYKTFTTEFVLSETNTYMVVAIDEWGNITQDRDIKYISIDNEAPIVDIFSSGEYLDYIIPENGFTNKEVITAKVKDNNPGGYLKYRFKNATNHSYSTWHTSINEDGTSALDFMDFMAEGLYEVIPVDAIGNEGEARHFIIYRSKALYNLSLVNEKDFKLEDLSSIILNALNGVIIYDFMVSWDNSTLAEYQAPIVKVTLNDKPYEINQPVNVTGEHVFKFTDLAGNETTFIVVLDKSSDVCLNNVKLRARARFTYPITNNTAFAIGDYKFRSDDVIVFAVRTNYYTGNSCSDDVLCYRQINKDSYFVVGNTANYFNNLGKVVLNTDESFFSGIDSLFGYAIVVSRSDAKNELGLPIGENFFTKDPIGWSIIFLSGVAVLYVGIRLVFFRKKVRVLK